MNPTEKNHYGIKVAILLLVIICLVQGAVIYSLTKSTPHKFDTISDFSSFIHDEFKKDNKQLWDNLDNYFDKDFFQKQPEPFVAMEKFHQDLEKMMDESFKNPFRHSWDSWITERFSGLDDTIDMTSKETKDSYIITFTMPDAKSNKLDINIDENGISLQGEVSKAVEKKDAKGNIIARNEMRQSLSQQFPLPPDADYKTAEIKNHDNKMVITIQKIKPA